MDLLKPRERKRLLHRLTEGSAQARAEAARRALPDLESALDNLRDAKAGAKVRFEALREASGELQARSLAVNPIAERKSRTYRVWAPVILAVEAMLAAYTASLTITGGLALHLVAGVVATALFTGLAKLGVSAQVDGGRTGASSARLERQLRIVVLVAAVLLGVFFVARFFPFAELAFALASTGLSFGVAYLAGLTLTLADLTGASNREVERYSRIARLEAELERIYRMAETLGAGEEAVGLPEREPRKRAEGLAAVALVGFLLFPGDGLALERHRLHLWIDASGSLAVEELARIRAVLADPLPLLEALGASEITVTPFWAEEHALFGASEVWRVPERPDPSTCERSQTVFSATRKAREKECEAAQAQAQGQWDAARDEALAPYRAALAEIDGKAEQPATCLYPLMKRVAASGGFHLIISDGAHARCGPTPQAPRVGAIPGAVILLPDNGGEGVAARMDARAVTLRRLYPGLVILRSWQITEGADWDVLLALNSTE